MSGDAGFHDEKMALQPVLLTVVLCALWGGVAPTLKISFLGIPAVAAAGWRFLIGLTSILIWCSIKGVSWRLPKKFYKVLFGLSLVFVAQISILNVGTQLTSSNHSVLFLNANPLFVALLAHFLIPNDRLSWWKATGLLLAFVGVAAIFVETEGNTNRSALLGDVLVLGSGFLLGVIQIFSKFLVRNLVPVQIVIWQMMFGVPLFFFISFLFESNSTYNLTPQVIGSLIYQGVVVAGFCFVTWTFLLQRYSASRLSAFQFTTPIFGVLLSWLMFRDFASPTFLLGILLVSAGVYIVSSSPPARLQTNV